MVTLRKKYTIFRKYESFLTHENAPTQRMHISKTYNTLSPETRGFEGQLFKRFVDTNGPTHVKDGNFEIWFSQDLFQ